MNAESTPGPVDRRWSGARRIAGHGAAASLSLYLVVKVIWVVAGIAGAVPSDVGGADWIALNAVTVVMAAAGITLGLVLASDRGLRAPAVPLVLGAWIGGGFLVPLIPYMLLGTFLDGGGSAGSGEDGATAPAWEGAFLAVGFLGMAVGLAVALPVHLRERWPAAFAGRLGGRLGGRVAGGPRAGAGRARAAAVAAMCLLLAAAWAYWAAGGTLGLAAGRDRPDAGARLLLGNSALWALIAAWAVTARRPGTPVWLPMVLGFTASGSLFAWNAWKLPFVFLRPGDYAPLERPAVAVVEHGLGIAAGALLLAAVVRAAGTAESGASRRGSP
ncbi:hypothetical protein [Actinomadura sp. WMMB 499]|uniref:hypothetical protein n=1 Tax=Actinomadura sp. WMMB 499 TaxID=1219491 RepID=UPI001247ACCB|nr:hypothetical protein [Actinomadura sp. WMMB 499]QFG21027.1 hypothetical protein F7P10_07600 [Actinomadura sp. WMMB 499]